MAFRDFTAAFQAGIITLHIESWFSFDVKKILDLFKDDPLDLEMFFMFIWLFFPFSSINVVFSASRGGCVSVKNFHCKSEFFILLMKISLIL